MKKQVHFVVCADLDSETWWVEDTIAFHVDGTDTWNVDTEEFEPTDKEDRFKALKILNKGRDT
jgi:hypothetical protein